MQHFPGVTAHNFYHSSLDVAALKAAFARVIEKNQSLAGRLRTVGGDPDAVQVHFDGELGCPFYERDLDSGLEGELRAFDNETIARSPLDWERMVERLGIANTGIGAQQVDTDGPLCCITYARGAEMSVLSLSVSHLLGDGSTKFQVLDLLGQEFDEPGSSAPMAGRAAVMQTDEDLKRQYSQWSQSALTAFYPKLYQKHYLTRGASDFNMLTVHVQDGFLKKIKAAEAEKLPGQIFSGQDALISWLGNILGAKWFSFTVDLRGRAKELPPNSMGNAFQTWYGAPAAGPGKFDAMDVRRTIKAAGTDCDRALEEALFTGLDASIDVNSWVKLQHQPSFGGKPWRQVRAIGRASLPFLVRMNYHVIYQLEKGENVMFHFGLSDAETKLLSAAWQELGATSLGSASGAELEKFAAAA